MSEGSPAESKIVSAGTPTPALPFHEEGVRGALKQLHPTHLAEPVPPPARTEGWTKKGPGEGFLSRGKNVSGMFPGTGPEAGPNGGGTGEFRYCFDSYWGLDTIDFRSRAPVAQLDRAPAF